MLRVGAHGAATGTEPSWDKDPELSDLMVSAHLWIQDGLSALPGTAGMSCARNGSTNPAWHSFKGVLDPIPSTRTQPGSREPACSIPDSSSTGETPPEHSFAELSFHGIPGGAQQPRALTGPLPAGSQRSSVRNQFSKLGSNPPSQSLQLRRAGSAGGVLGLEVPHLIREQILSCMGGWEAGMGMMDRRKQIIK